MNGTDYAKLHMEQSFWLTNICADGMTEEQYNYVPQGNCNSPAKSHVHALATVDFFVNIILKGGKARWPAVAQEHGLPVNALEIWKHEGTIPYAAIKAYGQEVQKDAVEYTASISESDLDRRVNTPFGEQSAGWLLQLAGMHAVGHSGDVATVKGMQGLKGLPF
jgi:hypothetical protein